MKPIAAKKGSAMSTLVSIVVPVYNVKPYLDECVQSILHQTYAGIEVILVDDGSTDGSSALCDAYAAQDSRVSVIHKPNGGLSDARNAGLAKAQGDYICFIDSDDHLSETMIETLLHCAQKHKAEIAVCTFISFADELPVYDEAPGEIDCMTGKQYIEAMFRGQGGNTDFVAWNKLYRRSLFTQHQISYPVGRIHEDTFTTYKLLYAAKRVAVVQQPLYHYRTRSGSIMRSSLTKKRCIDAVDAVLAVVDDFHAWGEEELTAMAFGYACRSKIILYAQTRSMPQDRTFCRQYILETHRKAWRQHAHLLRSQPAKYVVFGLFALCPGVVSALFGQMTKSVENNR